MYYVVYGLLWLLSLLPLRILFILSDCIYGLAYYVFRYRKKIVMQNLLHAFPEKSEAERVKIAKKFYRNLTDTIVETVKLFTASEKFILKHMRCNNEILEKIYESGQRCHLHLGHNFNWELANLSLPLYSSFLCLDVYIPATSKIAERLIQKLRRRTGTVLIPATTISRSLLPYRHKQYLLIMVADQNPGDPGNAWWVKFFGKPLSFVKGPEKAARHSNAPVVFVYIKKYKRGYYEGVVTLMHEKPAELPEGELTRQYVRLLEQVIRQYPEMWLWSHRRWRWEWNPGYGPVME